jgi:hypothetical protein
MTGGIGMSIIKGEEAKKLNEDIRRRNAETRASSLAEALEESKTNGKELFDLEKVLTYYHFPRMSKEKLEYDYYVSKSSSMTLEDYANRVRESDEWDGVY